MAQYRRPHRKSGKGRRDRASGYAPQEPRPAYVPKPPVILGKPFTLLEDVAKNTFEYKSGAWIPFSLSIAECRIQGQVNELAQKVNQMTRYEVRLPQ